MTNKTTIEVTVDKVTIETEGFGHNALHRVNMPELWKWHEAVADVIARHHADVMGHFFACPEPA